MEKVCTQHELCNGVFAQKLKKKSLNWKVYRAKLNVAKLDACISKAITLVALVCTLKEKVYIIYRYTEVIY